ncbi:hypothetical protein RRG08_050660 [Elysia crispata]|uniref:Receptor ligand binding region domain-containing protein n=1 Tax=Elysia crispata TaxID=231223 RepID=A0AAE1AEJ7_9GAST|nr:hypothetical protein RRG08_050660 [Elysia crispata]
MTNLCPLPKTDFLFPPPSPSQYFHHNHHNLPFPFNPLSTSLHKPQLYRFLFPPHPPPPFFHIFPQLQPTLSLDNRIQYPYFSRTEISDTQQASANSLILQQLNVTYVGAVVFGNLYGRALYQRFREKAEAQGICVADAFEVTDKTTVDDLKPLLKEYREGAVGVVVAFVMDGVALNLVKARGLGPQHPGPGGGRWGASQGSLILEPTGFDVDYGFKKFVQTWGPQDAASDSWLRKYWENFFNCNLPRGFSNIHQTHCLTSPPYFSSKSLNQLDESPLVVHTIVATTTAGKAVQDHLSELPSSQEVVLPLDPAELSDKIRQVTLTSANGSKFKPFLASGNGNAGIKVYNVQQMEPGSYSYVEVGTFRSEILTMDQSKVKFYDLTGRIVENVDSSCKYKRECNTVCRSSQAPGVPASVKPGPGTGPEEDSDDKPELIVIILAVVVCVLLLIIIVIIVLAVLTCTGRLAWSRKEPSDNSWPMETYWQGSCASGFKPTYCQSGGSQSSSSFTASGGDLRPPLPQRKRKDTLSSERTAEPGGPAAGSSGSACKTASDVVVVKPGEDGLHSDSEVGQARCQSPRSGAAGLMDPRLAVDRPERMTPSPHRFWSSDLAASLVSSPSAPSSSGQSDNSCIVQNQSSSGAALADVEIQLNASKLHPLSEPAIASLIQQQQQQQQSQKLSQYPKYQQPHQQFSQTPQQQPYHENLQYQQQQAILHALQRPNLDERLRQLYISHLNQTQQPIEQAHQTNDPYQNGPNRQKGHIQQKGKPEAILEHPDKFVLFSNLSDARAIYTIPQSSQSVVTSSTDPDYIYVLTAEGMLSPVPYENYARLQEAGVVGNHQNIRSDAQGEENTNLTIKDQREAVFHGGEPAPMTGVVRAAPSPVQDVGHQPMVTPNGLAVHNPRDLVCAQILKQQPGQVPGYLYKPPRGHGVDQEDKASGKQASDDDRHPPPAPHSHQAGSDYLTVFSASGLVHTLSNQDSDMPALVMLPEEVFHTPENEPIAPQTQIPGRGEFQSSNSNRAPLDFPGSVRDPAGKPAQGVATTYTVASTDYPVKTNQTRMSPMPQKAHRHPHVTANLPDVEKHFGPEKWRHAHGNKGASSTFDQQPREPYQNRHEPSPNGVIPLDPSGLGFTSDPLPDVASNQPGQIYSDQAKDPNNPERSVYPQGTRITTDQYTSQNPPPVSQVISAVPGNQASHETGQNNKKQHSSETIASNSKNNKKNIGSTAGFDLGPANETSKVHQDISPALLDGDGVTAETRQTVVEAVDTSDNRMSSGSADFTSSADTDKINNGTRADGVGSEKKQVIRGGPGLPQQPDILENLAESEL